LGGNSFHFFAQKPTGWQQKGQAVRPAPSRSANFLVATNKFGHEPNVPTAHLPMVRHNHSNVFFKLTKL
jgi:hypothetical protein